MTTPKLLFLAGSTRTGSFNAQLAEAAARIAESEGTAEVTRIDLADYELPIYNGDLESSEGLPEAARQLKQRFRDHHGFLIASPEYNSTLAPVLVNALHWISRPASSDEPPLSAFQGKVAALTATSPGGLGGLRGLVPLRMMLSNIGVQVLPNQLAVPGAMKAFGDSGQLVDDNQQQALATIVRELIRVAEQIGKTDQPS
ncbi:NAD(P)H-dependent FMN reductase [Tamilnaduibacter salinus]|uniref:FMN reductase n=1 Tax=Tamilnaduibacter salinus TaxID=1484056 RepID=A0A2A2I1Q5_9GAMM|nr:NAD(P)H-dependent oxidoreductase [Tamilnaduibacter salinus]PAV25951.1 FMN reductase [Tamilnaduibacter salinus]PVY76268.1 NAD(P)H-dependent FMN reductase [Tamilnaduibacter salinus]